MYLGRSCKAGCIFGLGVFFYIFFQLAWTQPQCPKPCGHPFRPSQHNGMYQPMEFYNDVSVDHYKPSIFELIAEKQLQDLLQPTLKYILSICLSMLTLILHIYPRCVMYVSQSCFAFHNATH